MTNHTNKQPRRSFRLLLNAACTLMLFLLLIPLAGAQGVEPTEGDGSVGNPWEIATLENLIWVQDQTNTGTNWSADKYFKQTADIDLISVENWVPIGLDDSGKRFEGNYDGQNFTIRNLRIVRPNESDVGLFGRLHGNATIANLRVENAYVEADQRSGILAGVSSGSSNNILIKNISVQGEFVSNGSNERRNGGIFGNPGHNTKITEVVFIGSVTGGYDIGGLVGRSSFNAEVTFSYARATVTGTNVPTDGGVGILVGNTSTNQSDFAEMYGVGTASVSDGSANNAGLFGVVMNTGDKFDDIYWDNSEGLVFRGIAGGHEGIQNNTQGLPTDDMQGEDAKDKMTGSGGRWDFGVDGAWRVVTIPEDDYPVFAWQAGDEITISGKVTAVNKADVSGITVTAQVGDETFSDVTTLTEANGDYSFGVYTVPTRSVFARSTDDDGLPIGAAVVRTFTETTTVDLNLQPRSLTISSDPNNGWVRDGNEILAVEADAVLNINTLRDRLLADDVTIVAGVDILLNEEFVPGSGTTHALTLHAGGKIELQENARIETYGDIILESDVLEIHAGARLKSDQELFIRPRTESTTIGVAGATGDLQLNASYFEDNFEAGFSQITIGSPTQTGNINLNDIEFRDNMRLQTSGTVVVNGNHTITLPNGVRLQVENDLQMDSGAKININNN